MNIILKKNVESLGAVGEIVKVADGYARNFLFPKGFAIQANDKNKKLIEKFKDEEEKRLAEEQKQAEMIIKQIEKTSILFTRLSRRKWSSLWVCKRAGYCERTQRKRFNY